MVLQYYIMLTKGGRYEGEWKNDIREGYAKEYLPNGNWYKGEIKNEKYDGYGIFCFPNGDLFEGGWKKACPNGYGIFYSSLGFQIEWYFKGTKLNSFILIIVALINNFKYFIKYLFLLFKYIF